MNTSKIARWVKVETDKDLPKTDSVLKKFIARFISIPDEPHSWTLREMETYKEAGYEIEWLDEHPAHLPATGEEMKAWIEAEAEKQMIFPHKRSGDRKAYDTMMLYEVNDERYDAFERGAWAACARFVDPLQQENQQLKFQLAEAMEALDYYQKLMDEKMGVKPSPPPSNNNLK